MSQPVKIENDAIRMEVWPQTGGKVSSIIDKADQFELLFSYPAELPTASQYDIPYANSWYAGWDECFPAVHPSKYTGHPYDGIAVPDHGELWGLPTTAVPTKDGITTVWHGLRFGYRLTRELYLDGPAVVSEYTLINLAPFEFRFVWAMHALMAMTPPAGAGAIASAAANPGAGAVELDLAAGSSLFRFSHDHVDKEIQQPFEWPTIAPGENASRPATLPKGRGWFVIGAEPIESEMVVRYPSRGGRTVRIGYSSEDELPAYWGVWLNTGGWNGHRHFAIQPTTGRYSQIDRAIRDGSAGRIAALGRRSWSVRWQLA